MNTCRNKTLSDIVLPLLRNQYGREAAQVFVEMTRFPKCLRLLAAKPEADLPRIIKIKLKLHQYEKHRLESSMMRDGFVELSSIALERISKFEAKLPEFEKLREKLRKTNDMLFLLSILSATNRTCRMAVATYFERSFLPICMGESFAPSCMGVSFAPCVSKQFVLTVLRLKFCFHGEVTENALLIDDGDADSMNLHDLAHMIPQVARTSLSVRKKTMFLVANIARLEEIGPEQITGICTVLDEKTPLLYGEGEMFGYEMDDFATSVLIDICAAGSVAEREYYIVLASTILLHLVFSYPEFLNNLVGRDTDCNYAAKEELLSSEVDPSLFSLGLEWPDNFAKVAEPLVRIIDQALWIMPNELSSRSTKLLCLSNTLKGWLRQKAEQEEEMDRVQVESLSI